MREDAGDSRRTGGSFRRCLRRQRRQRHVRPVIRRPLRQSQHPIEIHQCFSNAYL